MSKRQRYTSGQGSSTDLVGSIREREPKSASTLQFEDFRRRHIKQNREVIAANVAAITTLSTINAEVFALRSEILEVRQQNLSLRRELHMRASASAQAQAAVLQPEQRQAIETILAAVPALQHLLAASLQVTPPTPQSLPEWLSPNSAGGSIPPPACQMPVIFTKRPAAIAAAAKDAGLGTLVEDSERGSEVDPEEVEERISRIASKGRTSGIASESTRPASPPPLPARTPKPLPKAVIAAVQSPLLSSPSTRASPRRKSRGGEKARRRRESGLLLPLVPPIPAEHVRPGKGRQEPEEGEREELVDGDERDEGHGGAVREYGAAVYDHGEGSVPGQRGSAHGSPSKISSAKLGDGVPLDEPAPGSVSNDTRGAASVSEDVVTDDGEGGNGGRGRRSRNSVVSYKEPSLNKKMRKPDGTPVEDALKIPSTGPSRSSLASGPPSSSSSPTKPISTEVIPSAEAVPANPTAPFDIPTQNAPAGRRAKPEAVAAALRRKSVLPRPGGRNRASSAEVVGSTDEHAASRQDGDVQSGPGPGPEEVRAEGTSAQADRTSPRKSPRRPSQQTLRHSSSTSALAGMKRVPSGGIVGGPDSVQYGKGRDPLVDRNDNGQGQAGKRVVSGSGSGVSTEEGAVPRQVEEEKRGTEKISGLGMNRKGREEQL